MSDRTTMSTENDPARRLDSGAWEGIQDAVRAFRQALERGKQPAIEDYLTAGTPHRVILLRELIHEELELHLKTGRPAGVADFIGRFPEIANDPDAPSGSRASRTVLAPTHGQRDRADRTPGRVFGAHWPVRAR